MTGPCRVHVTVTIGLHVEDGTWQVNDAEAGGHPVVGTCLECEEHRSIAYNRRCAAVWQAPPLPTLTQLADLIGELLRRQGFAATQAVLDGETP